MMELISPAVQNLREKEDIISFLLTREWLALPLCVHGNTSPSFREGQKMAESARRES
jgi:hypothetical protein